MNLFFSALAWMNKSERDVQELIRVVPGIIKYEWHVFTNLYEE
jgi:hypothetical protein